MSSDVVERVRRVSRELERKRGRLEQVAAQLKELGFTAKQATARLKTLKVEADKVADTITKQEEALAKDVEAWENEHSGQG